MLWSDFDEKCTGFGLISPEQRATAFLHTPHTFRHYRRRARNGDFEMPVKFDLLMAAYEDIVNRHPGKVPMFNQQLSEQAFHAWCRARNLTTYEKIGEAFGYSRQAVWNWYNRVLQGKTASSAPSGRPPKEVDEGEPNFPSWLPMGCYGHDVQEGVGSQGNFAGDRHTPKPTLMRAIPAQSAAASG